MGHLAALLLLLARPQLPPAFVPPPILMYHRVDVDRPADRVGRELTVSPTQFEAQLAYLKSRGYAGITMADLCRRLELGRPLDHVVVLTFDDGYADQYRYALPLLRRFGDAATFYIVTGFVDMPHHLTWAQLKTMRDDGEDIGAHGITHDDLSRMPARQQAKQIYGSLRALQLHLGASPRSYAYPSGQFNRATLALVRDARVELAVTTDARYVVPPPVRLELARVRVRSDWTIGEFAAAIRRALIRGTIVRR